MCSTWLNEKMPSMLRHGRRPWLDGRVSNGLHSHPQLNIWNISYISSQVTKLLYLMRRIKVNIIHAFWCGLVIGLPLPSSKYPSEAMFKDLFQAAKRNGSKYIIIYLNAVSCDLCLHYFIRCHALQYARFVYRNQISICHCYQDFIDLLVSKSE